MKKITKTYKNIKLNGKEFDIDCIIHQGFDKELLINHPSFFEKDEKPVYLYMFIPFSMKNNEWLTSYNNTNPYIYMAFSVFQESNFDFMIKLVDKIQLKQREAVEEFINRKNIEK